MYRFGIQVLLGRIHVSATFFILLILFFSVFPSRWAIAQEAQDHVSTNAQPQLSECWGPKCRVEVAVDPFVDQMGNREPEAYMSCPTGPAIPEGMDPLPPGHAYSDPDKKTFILPIHRNPEKFLEEGDILIRTSDGSSFWDQVTEQRDHGMLVVNDKAGKPYHLDSPLMFSSDNFNSHKFHILRVRKYPIGVDSGATLAKWRADPKKAKELEAWATKREGIIKNVVTKVKQLLKHGGWGNDEGQRTEFASKAHLRKWQTNFLKECKASNPKFYCSEMPISLYATEGLPLPDSKTLVHVLNNVAEKTIQEGIERGFSRREVIEREVGELFSNLYVLRRMPALEREAFRTTVIAYLTANPEQRSAIAATIESVSEGVGVPISPSDVFKNIGDSADGYLSYAGTYVGNACGNRNEPRSVFTAQPVPQDQPGVPWQSAQQPAPQLPFIPPAPAISTQEQHGQDMARQIQEVLRQYPRRFGPVVPPGGTGEVSPPVGERTQLPADNESVTELGSGGLSELWQRALVNASPEEIDSVRRAAISSELAMFIKSPNHMGPFQSNQPNASLDRLKRNLETIERLYDLNGGRLTSKEQLGQWVDSESHFFLIQKSNYEEFLTGVADHLGRPEVRRIFYDLQAKFRERIERASKSLTAKKDELRKAKKEHRKRMVGIEAVASGGQFDSNSIQQAISKEKQRYQLERLLLRETERQEAAKLYTEMVQRSRSNASDASNETLRRAIQPSHLERYQQEPPGSRFREQMERGRGPGIDPRPQPPIIEGNSGRSVEPQQGNLRRFREIIESENSYYLRALQAQEQLVESPRRLDWLIERTMPNDEMLNELRSQIQAASDHRSEQLNEQLRESQRSLIQELSRSPVRAPTDGEIEQLRLAVEEALQDLEPIQRGERIPGQYEVFRDAGALQRIRERLGID